MTTEELDRLSVLLCDAYKALDEAWPMLVRAGDNHGGHTLLAAAIYVQETAEKVLGTHDFSVKV